MNKKSYKILILSMLLAISFVGVLVGASEEAYVPDDVQIFLRDVVKLNMAKYIVTPFEPSIAYWDDLGGLPQLTGVVKLNSLAEPSDLDVYYSFVNNTLNSLSIDVRQGSSIFSQAPPADIGSAVKGFLQRYQAFTGDSSLEAMQNALNMIDATRNTTEVIGNLKLTVSIGSFSSHFGCGIMINGAKYSGLGVSYENGNFLAFSDDRSYRGIGSTVVNVVKEEAVGIALKKAENYSYGYAGEVINNFTIVKDRIGAELLVMGRDNPLLGYPYWTVSLVLDHVYPGFVYWIEVRMWADTGEIIDIKPMGYGGPPPAETPSEPAETPEPSETTSTGPEDLTLTIAAMAGVIVTFAGLAAATMLILKKGKNSK